MEHNFAVEQTFVVVTLVTLIECALRYKSRTSTQKVNAFSSVQFIFLCRWHKGRRKKSYLTLKYVHHNDH